MSTTVVERVSGEFVGEKTTHRVDLKLTITETPAHPPNTSCTRTIEDIEPVTLSGIPDGDYTLRFPFGGEMQAHTVRISYGYLLAR